MFSSKPKAKIDLDRAASSSAEPIEILRPMQDMRRRPRKGVWCVCTVYTKTRAAREGIILDVSQSGARVRFRNRGRLPHTVKIKASRMGLNRYARVVWQTTFDAGLEFLPDPRKS